MTNDFLTLEEAARLLKKSTQTIRRMIKKGELQAQRIRTPQGFNYTVTREQLAGLVEASELIAETNKSGEIMFSNSPIQKPEIAESVEENHVLINQNQNPTNQNQFEPIPEPEKQAIDKTEQKIVYYFPPLPPSPSIDSKELLKLIERQHREHMGLIRLLEHLQAELNKVPKGRLERFLNWLQGN